MTVRRVSGWSRRSAYAGALRKSWTMRAIKSGDRKGPNPAAWHGRLDQSLTHPGKLRKKKPVKHHRSIPYVGIGDFMRDLSAIKTVGAQCLEFVTLTGSGWPV